MIEPEEGLTYFAFTHEFAESESELLGRQLSTKAGSGKICTSLTPDPTWLPLYPFRLSLSPSNLIPFIERRLEVAVLIDVSVLKRKFADHGVHAIAIMDGMYSFQLCLDPSDLMKGVFRVSERLFARISCEFQSLDWFVKEHASAFDKALPLVDVALDSPGEYRQMLDDWRDATCIFANLT